MNWQLIDAAPWPKDLHELMDRPVQEWIVCSNRGRVFAATPHCNGWVYSKNYRHQDHLDAMPGPNGIRIEPGPLPKDCERAVLWMPLPDPPEEGR